jgi:hypothetical protein
VSTGSPSLTTSISLRGREVKNTSSVLLLISVSKVPRLYFTNLCRAPAKGQAVDQEPLVNTVDKAPRLTEPSVPNRGGLIANHRHSRQRLLYAKQLTVLLTGSFLDPQVRPLALYSK